MIDALNDAPDAGISPREICPLPAGPDQSHTPRKKFLDDTVPSENRRRTLMFHGCLTVTTLLGIHTFFSTPLLRLIDGLDIFFAWGLCVFVFLTLAIQVWISIGEVGRVLLGSRHPAVVSSGRVDDLLPPDERPKTVIASASGRRLDDASVASSQVLLTSIISSAIVCMVLSAVNASLLYTMASCALVSATIGLYVTRPLSRKM